MQQPARRTALAAAAVLALAVTTAGCGGDEKPAADAAASTSATSGASVTASPTDTPTDTPSSTPSASAAATTGTASGALTRDTFVAAMTKAMKDRGSAHMHMSMAGSLEATGDVSYAGDSPAMQMTMTMASMSSAKIEMRFLDGTMYLSVPGLTPKGKYLAVTSKDASFGPMIKQFQNFGPDGTLAMLKKGVKKFEHVGSTTIDGTSFEHYRVTVDPRALTSELGLPSGAPGSVPKSVTEELYIGQDNLMRRAVMTVSGQKFTVDVTDWGKAVHITAPPASQVTKAPAGLAG
jgi:hypothetical protein